MGQDGGLQSTVDKLYALYNEQGFLRKEEALALMTADGVSLVGISRITNRLLLMGVIFLDDADDFDYSQTDYESIFNEVLEISSSQRILIDYIRNVRAPQYREWQFLIPQARSGNYYAFKRLFDMYLRVALKISLSVHKDNGFELDDAIQEGAIGLIHAIDRFDFSRHGNFGSYLSILVQQYVFRAFAITGRTIRLPVHLLETLKSIERATESFIRSFSREPILLEIAETTGIEPEKFQELSQLELPPLSLDGILTDDSEENIAKTLVAPIDEQPFEKTAYKLLQSHVLNALHTLSDREARVLSLRYGLFDGKERTLEEVGQIFDVTRERIRQIEANALRKLRQPSRAKYLIDYYD